MDAHTKLTRVLIVDDHPVILDGVTMAFEATSWLKVAGYARNGREGILAAQRLKPDVVLLDLRLPDMLGSEVVAQLRAHVPGVKVVVFTAHPDHAGLDVALAAGVHGVVLKDADRTDLVEVMDRIVAGERVVHLEEPDDNALLTRRLKKAGLTRREYDILRRVAMGETNAEIAVALGLTRNTVKTYLQRTLEKLGARNRVQAVARANEHGLL